MDPAMTSLLTERLGDRATQDPLTALMLQQLQRATEEREDDSVDELRRKLERATRRVDRLRAEVEAANAMARHVAGLLGACIACWGLNPVCPHCLGRGRPGCEQPAIDELVAWITPALHRAGLTTVHRAGSPPRSALPEGAMHGSS